MIVVNMGVGWLSLPSASVCVSHVITIALYVAIFSRIVVSLCLPPSFQVANMFIGPMAALSGSKISLGAFFLNNLVSHMMRGRGRYST